MADDINITYSYQTERAPTPVTGGQEMGPLYAFIECERVDLGIRGVLLIHRRSNRQMVVAPEVSQALHACTTFRTLNQHADFLVANIPELAGQREDVGQVLKMVCEGGVMTSADAICGRLQAPLDVNVLQAPTRVFVITCDRPAAVQRLLRSMHMAGNLSRHQQLFLVDDSREASNAEMNRQLVEDFNINSPRDMQYVGSEQQQRLLQGLVAQLPEHENGIRFLIDRERWRSEKSYGLARTLCLLLSIDCRAIIMDDDVICAAVPAPHRSSGVGFQNTSREVDFYASEQDIQSKTAKADFDPLNGHARCLGMPMGQALEELGFGGLQGVDLAGANASYLSQWHASSKVLVTQSGSLGDPGTGHTDWIYGLQGASLQRLLDSEGGLQGAVDDRHYWMGHTRPTFSKMSVISQVTGLDNTHLLPPYFPVFRGEDYLFGAMVEYLHPQAAVLEYDWCVPHFPLEARRGGNENLPATGKGGINLAKFVTDRTCYEEGISADTRFEQLALLVGELAEYSDEGLLTLYRAEVAEAQVGELQQLSNALQDDAPRSDDWRAYLQQGAENVAAAMSTLASVEDIAAIPDSFDQPAILAQFRQYAGDYALALRAWGKVRQAAGKLVDEMLEAGQLAP